MHKFVFAFFLIIMKNPFILSLVNLAIISVLCGCASTQSAENPVLAATEFGFERLKPRDVLYWQKYCFEKVVKPYDGDDGDHYREKDCTLWFLETPNHELVLFFPNAKYRQRQGRVVVCIIDWKLKKFLRSTVFASG